MKKVNIIRKSKEFEKIIKYNHHYSNRFFVVYIIEKSKKYSRFGISVSKKVGNSVVRNKIKRQVKSIIDNNKDIKNELDYVIIVKKEILKLNYNDKVRNIKILLDKIDGAWKSEKV